MKVEFKVAVELTEEEIKAIEKVRDILCNYELCSCSEQDDALSDEFEQKMGYLGSNYSALCVSTDFLTYLLRKVGYEKEEM